MSDVYAIGMIVTGVLLVFLAGIRAGMAMERLAGRRAKR